jgi:hypothetical protein
MALGESGSKKKKTCLHGICGKIPQMPTFIVNIRCPKAYHRPDYSMRISIYIERMYTFFFELADLQRDHSNQKKKMRNQEIFAAGVSEMGN